MVGSETTIALSGVYVGGEQVFSTQDWVDQKVDQVKWNLVNFAIGIKK